MANTRRTIRKTVPSRLRQLDDQLWPLVVAFCVLGGFLAGTVLAYLRMDDPRWYANAWTYLIAIPLVVALSLLALAWTGNRLLRRTMQLALVLCAIFHMILLIGAIETDVFRRVWIEVLAATQPPQRRVMEARQYTSWHHDPQQRMQREFSAPVETELPEPVTEPQPRERRPEELPEVDTRPPTVAAAEPVQQPDVVRREQINQAVPRQRPESSRLSRHQSELLPHPVQTVPLPQPQPQPQRQPDVPQPGDSSSRQAAATQVAERTEAATPTAAPAQATELSMTRRQLDAPRPASSSAAMRPRSEARAEITPRAEIAVADQPAIAQRTDPQAPQPNNTLARQQTTQAPQRRQRAPLPVQVPVEQSPRQRALQSPAPARAALAQTPRPVETPRARTTERPDLSARAEAAQESGAIAQNVTAAPAAQAISAPRAATADHTSRPAEAAAAEPSRAAHVEPRATARTEVAAEGPSAGRATANAVAPGRQPSRAAELGTVAARISPPDRQPSAQQVAQPAPSAVAAVQQQTARAQVGNASSAVPLPSAALASSEPATQRPHRQTGRQTTVTLPAVDDSALATSAPPRRASRVAPRAESPVPAESPLVQSHAPGLATPAPAALALNRGQTGVAGRGASVNLGMSDPAGDSPAQVASGAAQRAQATQQSPTGPALTPQAAALVRNGRTGQREPSAVLRATPLAPTTLTGSRQPEAVNASSSAALTAAASDVQRGEVTAAKGTLDIDIGPTTRVAEAGSGRAEGGGLPRRSSGTSSAAVPRAALGQAAAASLLADITQPIVAAPLQPGGSSPSTVELELNPNAAVQSRDGAANSVGGPVAAAGGMLAAPTQSLTPSSRRAAQAGDGPSLASTEDPLAAPMRKTTRTRQLDSPTGAADLMAGNAAERTDRTAPASELAASAAASEVGKQSTGGIAEPGLAGDPVGSLEAEPGPSALVARAEAVQARMGPATPGGGTDAPARSARGPELAIDTTADTIAAAGAAMSQGHVDAEPQSTQGPLLTRLAGGLNAARSTAPAGADPGDLVAEGSPQGQPGSGPSSRASRESAMDGPAAIGTANASPLVKKSPGRALAFGTAPLAVSPGQMPTGESSDMEPGPLADAPRAGVPSRLAGAPLPVLIDTTAGPGGLAQHVTVEVGTADRRALQASDNVQLQTARFARQRVGGTPTLDTSAAVATAPFRRRQRRQDGMGDAASGTGPETEEAIELGLVFLSRIQSADGRWTLDQQAPQDGLPQLASDTAATGLALLAFQGAGYNHLEYRYAKVVRGGVDFLVSSQQPNGDLFVAMDGESNRVVALYSHSIAALALCEAYGMTQDPSLRDPAQKALDFIVQSQHQTRGGWRYAPRIGSDTSVTGWMMMALKSGELADLEVPRDTYQRIRSWLDRAQASPSQPHLYCYNPYAPDTDEQRAGRRPSHTMTAVGLLMRLYSGWRRDNPHMHSGADYLATIPPAVGTSASPQRDTYYWYYATQVMFHMGGQHWQAWQQRLHPLLVGSQVQDGELAGSWDPNEPVPDRWAPFAGRLYVTTMNLLSLEVTYRYLPLYEDTAR